MELSELAKYLSTTDWYRGALNRLVEMLNGTSAMPAHPVRLGSQISVRLKIEGKIRSRLLGVSQALACTGGSAAAINALIFSFMPTYEMAMVVSAKVRMKQAPRARIVEAMLIADAREAAGAHLATLGAALAAHITAACAKSGDAAASAAAKRKIAVEKARRHVQRAVNAGITREDLLMLYDEFIAEKIKGA